MGDSDDGKDVELRAPVERKPDGSFIVENPINNGDKEIQPKVGVASKERNAETDTDDGKKAVAKLLDLIQEKMPAIVKILTKNKKEHIKKVRSIFTWEFYQHRWEIGNLRKYLGCSIEGEDADDALQASDVDMAVNLFTLVSTLVLTIPFGLMGSLTNSYWDWLSAEVDNCLYATETYPNGYWQIIYEQVINNIFASIYTALVGIVLSVFYYLLRPSDQDDFVHWWSRGKYIVVFIFANATCSVVTIVNLFNALSFNFINGTDHYCYKLHQNSTEGNTAGILALSYLIAAVLIGIAVMA